MERNVFQLHCAHSEHVLNRLHPLSTRCFALHQFTQATTRFNRLHPLSKRLLRIASIHASNDTLQRKSPPKRTTKSSSTRIWCTFFLSPILITGWDSFALWLTGRQLQEKGLLFSPREKKKCQNVAVFISFHLFFPARLFGARSFRPFLPSQMEKFLWADWKSPFAAHSFTSFAAGAFNLLPPRNADEREMVEQLSKSDPFSLSSTFKLLFKTDVNIRHQFLGVRVPRCW